MTKLRAIHVGLGRWGMNRVIEILAAHPDIDTVAYVDADEGTRTHAVARLGYDPSRFFPSLAAAIDAVEADCVIVSVPTPLHAALATEAMTAGLHVLLEKPFAATVSEAEELLSIAKDRSLILAVSQNYRYYSPPQIAAAAVRDGSLGRLLSVKIDFRRNSKVEGHGYLGIANPLLVDMAVHHYDLMRMIIGETADEVNCVTWNPLASPFHMDPAGMIVLRYPSGVVASYRGSWVDQGPQTAWAGEWQLDFERGTLFWTARDEPPDTQHRDSVRIVRLNAPPQIVATASLQYYDRAGVLHDFARAVAGEAVPSFFPVANTNIGTLKTVEAVLRSAALGGATAKVN